MSDTVQITAEAAWEAAGQNWFQLRTVLYVLFLLLLTFTGTLISRGPMMWQWLMTSVYGAECAETHECSWRLHPRQWQLAVSILAVPLAVMCSVSIARTALVMWEAASQEPSKLIRYVATPWHILDLCGVALTAVMLFMWYSALYTHLDASVSTNVTIQPWQDEIARVAAVAVAVEWVRGLYFMRGYSSTAAFVHVLQEIIRDMWPITIMLGILIVGFACAVFIVVEPDDAYRSFGDDSHTQLRGYSTWMRTNLMVARWLLGDFGDLDEWEDMPSRHVLGFLFIVVQVLGVVVLLNMLIAHMGETYSRVAGTMRGQVVKERLHLILEAVDDYKIASRYTRSCVRPKLEHAAYVHALRPRELGASDKPAAPSDDGTMTRSTEAITSAIRQSERAIIDMLAAAQTANRSTRSHSRATGDGDDGGGHGRSSDSDGVDDSRSVTATPLDAGTRGGGASSPTATAV